MDFDFRGLFAAIFIVGILIGVAAFKIIDVLVRHMKIGWT
jgi:hypothetical protein